ncbi:MAG TPA: molybdate ABC transporter permease subunit [Verrucomicrobiae bacterium]|jgi:molybdate transport system permease protein|nr:molybdate ABC transporter permease subunit [Verrucomicrobiae bacterium]
MSGEEWRIVWFTAWVSLLAVACILPLGLPLAWALARREWPGKTLVETLVTMPLALPPVVTGLLLLKLLGRRGVIGRFFYEQLHIPLVFTWRAVLAALMVMSFPLLVRAARSAFENVNPRFEQMARTLGAGELRIFFTITAPLAWRGILGGMLLAFARSLGEFGATIMVAGNIPGVTATISLSIYEAVELGHDETMWRLLAVSAALAFGAVFASEWLMRRPAKGK